MYFTKPLVLFFSAISVSALATPHVNRGVHHRALAGRIPVPVPAGDAPALPLRSRQNGKRCKPRPSSQAAQPSTAPETTTKAAPPPPSTHNAQVAPKPTTEAPPPPPTTHEPSPTPQPTTKEQPPPPPATTTKKAAPPPPSKPAPPPASNLPSFLVGTQTGQGTFYATGLGACGITNSDSDHIAAVSHLLFDAFPNYNGVNPNSNPICGRKVTATYQGKSVTVSITDRCTGCALTDLDFSPSAFGELADFSLGRLSGVKWNWD